MKACPVAEICYVILTNGALATLLALCVYAATSLIRPLNRPAVKHLLWVLVLLRMIVPPVLQLDVSPARDWVANNLNRQAEGQEVVLRATLAESSEILTAVFAASQESRMLPAKTVVPRSAELAATKVTAFTAWLRTTLQRIESFARYISTSAALVLFPIWAIGALYFLSTHLRASFTFRRNIKEHAYSSRLWQRRTERVAKRMGLSNCPKLLLVRASISPMLWGFGPTTRILFPEKLLENLTVRAQDTLIAHELAHYRRGDQWVRILELVGMSCFWWHPVFWWTLGEIEKAEEQCCDAWAVRQANGCPRTYAEALLATVDFVSVSDLPPVASGAGGTAFLRERIQAIMCHRMVVGKTLLPTAYPCIVPLAALVLIPSPVFLTNMLPPVGTGATAPAIAATSIGVVEGGVLAGSVQSPTLRDGNVNLDSARLVIDPSQRATFRNAANDIEVELGIGNVSASCFSSDGKTLAIGTNDGALRLIDCEDGAVIREVRTGYAKVSSISFAPDDELLAVGTRDGVCRLVDLAGKDRGTIVRKQGKAVKAVSFSKNGRYVASVWKDKSRHQVEFLSLSDGEVSTTASTKQSIVAAFDNVAGKSGNPSWRFVRQDGSVLSWNGKTEFEVVDGVSFDDDEIRQLQLAEFPRSP